MRAAVVAVVVLLAGCSGVALGPGGESETVTPVPVPTDSGFPPGLGPSGVEDVSTLAASHAGTLDETSFTVLTNRTVRWPNGSIRSAMNVRLKLSATRNYHADVSVYGSEGSVIFGEPPTEAEYWANDEVYLRRQEIDNRTVFSRYSTSEEYVGTWRFWLGTIALDIGPSTDLRRTVGSFDTRVAGQPTVDGEQVVHITGTAVTSERFVDDQSDAFDVRNATLHAFVTESGFVRSYYVIYEADLPDQRTVTIRRSVRFRDVDSTTIDRPPWYDEAIADR